MRNERRTPGSEEGIREPTQRKLGNGTGCPSYSASTKRQGDAALGWAGGSPPTSPTSDHLTGYPPVYGHLHRATRDRERAWRVTLF